MNNNFFSAIDISKILGNPEPSEEQQKIIESDVSNTLIIAGAGSGKTETLVNRLIWLILNKKIEPEKVLGLTFTKKASNEFNERLRKNILKINNIQDLNLYIPEIRTYDSFFNKILRENLSNFFENDLNLVDENIIFQEAKEFISNLEIKPNFEISEETLAQSFLQMFYEIKTNQLDINSIKIVYDFLIEKIEYLPPAKRQKTQLPKVLQEIYLKTKLKNKLLEEINNFENVLLKKRFINFIIQLSLLNEATKNDLSISKRISSNYNYIMLDEYQDTSILQKDFLKSIFSTKNNSKVIAVGDPNQTIYSWRGAESRNIFDFEVDFPNGNRKNSVFTLSTSWRNSAAVLKVSNFFSSKLLSHDINMTNIELLPAFNAKKGLFEVNNYTLESEELESLFQKVKELPGEKVILTRRNSEAIKISNYFEKNNLETEINIETNFLNSIENQLVINYLRIVLNLNDEEALINLLINVRWGISLKDLEIIKNYNIKNKKISLFFEIQNTGNLISKSGKKIISKVIDDIKYFISIKYLSPSYLINEIYIKTFLDSERELKKLGLFNFAQDNKTKLLELAAEFEKTNNYSLYDFLNFLETYKKNNLYSKTKAKNTKIKIMTIHSAKGLEWDHVFLPFMQEDIFPLKPREFNWVSTLSGIPKSTEILNNIYEDRKDLESFINGEKTKAKEVILEEEKKLFYVAVTRAKQNVFVSYSNKTIDEKDKSVSQFIEFLIRENECNDLNIFINTNENISKNLNIEDLYFTNFPFSNKNSEIVSKIEKLMEIETIDNEIDLNRLVKKIGNLDLLNEKSKIFQHQIINAINLKINKQINSTNTSQRFSINQFSKKNLFEKDDNIKIFKKYRKSKNIKEFESDLYFHFKIENNLEIKNIFDLQNYKNSKYFQNFKNSYLNNYKLININKKFELLLDGTQIYGVLPNIFKYNNNHEVVIWLESLPKTRKSVEFRKIQSTIYYQFVKEFYNVDNLKIILFNIKNGQFIKYTGSELLDLIKLVRQV